MSLGPSGSPRFTRLAGFKSGLRPSPRILRRARVRQRIASLVFDAADGRCARREACSYRGAPRK